MPPLNLPPALLTWLCLLLALMPRAWAQNAFSTNELPSSERGGKLILQLSGEEDIDLYKDSFALVIGVSQYKHWPSLQGVREDATAVAAALTRNGFKVTLATDPTLGQLEKVFSDFINSHGLDRENRLLFYFAGHGHTLLTSDGRTQGFLIPVDAPLPDDKDLRPFITHALPMDQIGSYATRIQAKHALFMFDACFAGTIFDTMRAAPTPIRYHSARPVRQFITSGAANETVPDRSEFRRQFLKALEGGQEEPFATDGYLTGEELGRFLQDTLIDHSQGRQHPEYGKLQRADLNKGDFIFELPTRRAIAQTGTAHLSLNAIPEAVALLNQKRTPGFPLIEEEVLAGEHRVTFKWKDKTVEKRVLVRPGDNICCTAFYKTEKVECLSRE